MKLNERPSIDEQILNTASGELVDCTDEGVIWENVELAVKIGPHAIGTLFGQAHVNFANAYVSLYDFEQDEDGEPTDELELVGTYALIVTVGEELKED